MNAGNRIFRFQSSPQAFIAVAVTAVLAVAISFYCLNLGIFIVFQNLFYFPIIVSCIYYLKRGFVFSVILSSLYFFLIVAHTADAVILIQALIRGTIFIAVAGVVTFLSMQSKQAEEALRANRRQLMDIIEFLPDATLAIDKEGRVIIWNKAIENMTGITAAEIEGEEILCECLQHRRSGRC